MDDSERSTVSGEPVADDYRAALELIEADLLAVVQRHASRHSQRIGSLLAAHATIELTGAVCGAVIEAMPDTAVDVNQKLASLQLHVMTTNGTRQ
jgi:hypothetical protein